MISLGSVSQTAFKVWRRTAPMCGAGSDDCFETPLDFHDYAQKISTVGADVLLTNPSRHSWRLSHRLLGRIVVQSGTAGGATISHGIAPAGAFAFYLPGPDCYSSLTLNGQPIAANELLVLPPGEQFGLACREGYKWISLSVPRAAFEAAEVSQVQLLALGAGAALIPMRITASEFSAAVGLDSTGKIHHASSQHSRDMERALLKGLVAAVTEAPRGAGRYPTRRRLDRINRDALAFIRAQDGLDFHVEDLCRAIDVAERSLLRAFHKFYGMGPTQYMKIRRLNNVHRALRERIGCATTVTGIMTTCGVTEFGRFAGAYRELFGESPSATLKRTLETTPLPARGSRQQPGRCETRELVAQSAA